MTLRRLLLLAAFLSAFLPPGAPAVAQDFHGRPVEGRGGDSALNALKNRTEVPAAFEAIDFEALTELEVPAGIGKRPRAHWPAAVLASVGAQEKRAVQVVGYLLKVKLEGREAANCGSDDPRDRDFHVWLANSPD